MAKRAEEGTSSKRDSSPSTDQTEAEKEYYNHLRSPSGAEKWRDGSENGGNYNRLLT